VQTPSTTPLTFRHLLTMVTTVALVAAALPLAVASAEPGAGIDRALSQPHAKNRVIVGFKPRASKAKRKRGLASVDVVAVETLSPVASDSVVVELAPGQSVAGAMARIAGKPGVAYVEPDYRVRPAASADDPWYTAGDHWGMYGDDTSPHANRFGSGAGEAWAKGHVGSPSVYVGVIDEGVKLSHPDLAANIWSNPWESVNGRDDDGNGYVDDVHGWDFYNDDVSVYDGMGDDHGTHVAGTIGARGGNGTGVAGVNWRVTLIPANFMGAAGGYISDAVRAIDYITDLKTRHGLDIVATNDSWSGGGFSEALSEAIDRAGDAGILFVAAAGNEGVDIDSSPRYPAAYTCTNGGTRGWDCLISVGSLEPDGDRASDSDWGAVRVDLGAPGTDIISTHPDGDSGYAYYDGTSMAAAHVTGAVALCASLDPSLSARQIRKFILSTGTPTDSLAGRTVTGDRLDIGVLVGRCAPAQPTPTPRPTPRPTPTPAPAPTPHPTSPPLTTTKVYVDDLDSAFRRFGTDWREGDTGYAAHHYWTPTRADSRLRYAVWRPVLPAAGYYRIVVYIPTEHANSRSATYKIKSDDGWIVRVRNQRKLRGTWANLGVHWLTTRPTLKLMDKTGESTSMGRRLAFDAARFVPVDTD